MGHDVGQVNVHKRLRRTLEMRDGRPMARPKPEKKRERKPNGQLPLPTSPAPASARATRVLPMDLRIGDRLVDETGEWEVVSRPYTSNAGKNASVRVKKAGPLEVTEIRSWGAHERVAVTRGGPKA